MKPASMQAYVAAHVVEDGDCLRWVGPFSNGSPIRRLHGKYITIRRYLYEVAHGPIPAGKVMRCTCGMNACVNLEHARLTTHSSIAKECGALGLMSGAVRSAKIAAAKRAGPQAKITQDDVRAFRASDEPAAVFARRHGISQSTACKIRRNEIRREFAGNPWAALHEACA